MAVVPFFVRAYAQRASRETEVTVFFKSSSSTIDRNYFGNAGSLEKLDRTIDIFRMNIDSVTIVAYASPDGNAAYNTALSARRAAAMHKYLTSRYPDVDFKNVREVVGGPDFDGLTRKIEADSRVPYRSEVLAIVRNWGDNPEGTFAKLKALRGGAPYSYIRYHYLPWLRTATTVIFHYNASVSLYKEQQEQLGIKESAGFEEFVMPKNDVNWGQGSSSELMPSLLPGQASTIGSWAASEVLSAACSQPAGTSSSDKPQSGSFVFLFGLNSSEIDTGDVRNAAQLSALREAVASGTIAPGDEIIVNAFASPDGNAAGNKMLAGRRAETAMSFIENELPEGVKVKFVSHGEDWEGLERNIERNYNRPDREQVLAILRSGKSDKAKKAAINSLDPESRKVVVGEMSENLRSVSIDYTKAAPAVEEAPAPASAAVVAPADAATATAGAQPVAAVAKDAEVLDEVKSNEDNLVPVVDTLARTSEADTLTRTEAATTAEPVEAPADSAATETAAAPEHVAAPAPVKPWGTVIALKTNLLYDLVTALNVELEVPVANRFSVTVENVFPWWETGNKYCFQMWEMGAEARVWLKRWDVNGREKLRGWFAGLYGMSAKFDFQYKDKINYQGEYWSAGFTVGYSMPVGRSQWGNLEFSISDGYMAAPYRHYYPTDDYSMLIRDLSDEGTVYNFFLYPTKLKVSLVVPIPGVRKKEVSHE